MSTRFGSKMEKYKFNFGDLKKAEGLSFLPSPNDVPMLESSSIISPSPSITTNDPSSPSIIKENNLSSSNFTNPDPMKNSDQIFQSSNDGQSPSPIKDTPSKPIPNNKNGEPSEAEESDVSMDEEDENVTDDEDEWRTKDPLPPKPGNFKFPFYSKIDF